MRSFKLPSRPHGWKPPPNAFAADCLSRALPLIAPIRRQSVAEWAENDRYILDNGSVVKWRNSVVPYLIEPQEISTSRRFRAGVFVGPARSAKTEGMILNRAAHAICCDQQHVRVIHMNQLAALRFSQRKFDPMMRYSPAVKERKGLGRFDNNNYVKVFQGGMFVDFAWPVISSMTGDDLPVMLLTEYDRYPDDIGGEGDAFTLCLKRTQNAGSRGWIGVECSPGRPVLDHDFETPEKEPHLAPPCTGILSLYNRGTRGRFYWPCPDCGEYFEPDFKLLSYQDHGTPVERGQSVYMACPHCGCVLEHRHKKERNNLAKWLHESRTGELVSIHDADLRETDVASWWMNGTQAAFQNWSQLVSQYEAALEDFERNGDFQTLKTTINLDQGKPFSERIVADDDELSVKQLKDKAEKYPLNIAPPEARFLLVAVDVQKARFVVQVFAFGKHMEHWLIARFDIHSPPTSAPRAKERSIDPPRYLEDWDALFELLERKFPVQDKPFSLVPVALAVDSGGEDGVTRNAYAWYRRAKQKGYRGRVFLVKGMRGWDRDRAVLRTPEKQEGKRLRRASDLKLLQIGTWKLKSELVTAVSRDDPGPGACHLSKNLPSEVFEELCAEEKTAKGWDLKKGKKRNEAFDLGVYALGLAIVMKAERIDWGRPPAWAARLDYNNFAYPRPLGEPDKDNAAGAPAAGPPASPEPVKQPAAAKASKSGRVRRNRPRRRRSSYWDY